MKKSIVYFMSTALLLSSCTPTTYMGTSIGAQLGSIIGGGIGAMGGYHGDAAMGSVVGAIAGAAIGYGISSAVEEEARQEAEERVERRGGYDNRRYDDRRYDDRRYDNRGYDDYDVYDRERIFDSEVVEGTPVAKRCISISNKSYYDTNGDGMFGKNEVISIVFDVTNYSDKNLRSVNLNISPVTSQAGYFQISPSKTVKLNAGQTLRYTAKVKANRNISDLQRAEFILHASAPGNGDVTEIIKIKVKD